jgi:hypothetical protein
MGIRVPLRSVSVAAGVFLLALVSSGPGASTVESQTAPPASYRWRNLTPAEGAAPEPRRNGTAIYDPVARRIVVFGGTGGSGQLNDLWAFDLITLAWTRLQPSGRPPEPRLGHDAVYDPIGHQMVVWAGQQGERFFDDTWSLDLTSLAWRDVSPSRRPQARYGSASIFDPVERRLVQFAGFTDLSRRFQDTQAFDLDTHTWEELSPPGERPQVRCLLTAAYEASSHRMIIYGGQRNGPLDDLWAFDLGLRSWTNLTPAERPAGRFFAASFLDRAGRFIVFGGATEAGDVNEVWAYDLASGRWSQLEIEGAPSPRNGMMSAYVEEEGRFFIFGGTSGGGLFNEIWELGESSGASFD